MKYEMTNAFPSRRFGPPAASARGGDIGFASSSELRAQVLTACRVLTHFRIVEAFLVACGEGGEGGAGAGADGKAAVGQGNGMRAGGRCMRDGCGEAVGVGEAAEVGARAGAGGGGAGFDSPEGATRRHGDEPV